MFLFNPSQVPIILYLYDYVVKGSIFYELLAVILPVIDWTKMAQDEANSSSDYCLLEHTIKIILRYYIFILILINEPSSNNGKYWSLH